MSLFLTDDETRDLTGRARRLQQIEWLRSSGIPFYVNAAGKPIVLRATFTKSAEAAPAPAWTPNAVRRG